MGNFFEDFIFSAKHGHIYLGDYGEWTPEEIIDGSWLKQFRISPTPLLSPPPKSGATAKSPPSKEMLDLIRKRTADYEAIKRIPQSSKGAPPGPSTPAPEAPPPNPTPEPTPHAGSAPTATTPAPMVTLDAVIDHGQKAGKSPEEIAGAVKKWRDKARAWGEENYRETDPNKWFAGNRKLDARIRDELAAIQGREAAERIATEIRDPVERQRFADQYAQGNGDPNLFEQGSQARSLAEILNREVFQSPAFTLSGGGSGPMPFATEAGVQLGDFETQIRSGGDLDVVIRVDDEEKGSVRKAITIPEITDEDIEAARKKSEEEAERLRREEAKFKKAGEEALEYPSEGSLYTIGSLQREAETARLKAEAAKSRANLLSNPGRGRLALLRERVEEQIKADKDLKKVVGDVALGEDFWRGVQQTHLGARMAVADATGDEAEKTKLRELIGDLSQIYPGSTNLQFRGGAGAFASDASMVLGGMLPTMMVSMGTGGAAALTGAAFGGLTRTAALSPIGLSAYGNAYATMLNEADALDKIGRGEEAAQRRKDARVYALAQAGVEVGTELIFKEEMFRVGGKGFLSKVGAGAGQNTVEEFLAATGNAELDREFRDQLPKQGQIARETLLGTVVGGLMQVPGGAVEVFLPKPPPGSPAGNATPPPGTSPGATPPPSSAPPPGATPPPGSATPPPSSAPPPGSATPPPSSVPPPGSTPSSTPAPGTTPSAPPPGTQVTVPGDAAVYRIGGRSFAWTRWGWFDQDANKLIDPLAEPGLIVQLNEARRRLNSGEQPISPEVTLNRGETPRILSIDGNRFFMIDPAGRGWLEVFPATGMPSRLINFALEGLNGVETLRRLNAKLAQLRGEAAPAPSETPVQPTETAPPVETPPDEEDPAPKAPERPADGTVSSGKPNGAKARFRWRIVSRSDIEAMVVRDIEEAQTRQRKGNVASDEQRERMATGLDPDLVMESPVSSMGAPAVFEGKVLAGNGRADGISEAYRRGLAADYEARIREFAAERGLEVPDEPILIREIIDFVQGDARSFVVESNPKRGGMLAESVSEQALLDAETIGDEVLANLTFTADGNLTTGSLTAVATRLEEANRGITRTLSGQFDRSEATRRVMAAFLSRLVTRAGRDASDVASILETDGGKRAVSAIAQAAPRLSRLDDDLSLAMPVIESLLELKSGLSAVAKGNFRTIEDWLVNRTSELLASELNPVAKEILAEMVGASQSGASMREFLDQYLALAEAEQKERDNARTMGDIFGNERANQTVEDLFRKLGRLSSAPTQDGAGTGAGSSDPGGRETQGGRGSENGRGAQAPPVGEAQPPASEGSTTPPEAKSGVSRPTGPLTITDHLRFFPVGLRPMVRRMRELAKIPKPTWDQRSEMSLARFVLNAFNSGRKTIPREIWPWFETWEYLDRIAEFADMFSKEELVQIRSDLLELSKNQFYKNPPEWMAGVQYPAEDEIRIKMIGTIGDALKIKDQPQAPVANPEAEGQLIPEGEMPFNLAGETIIEPEPVEPEDTRTDAEKDEDSGQGRLFEDRISPPPARSQQGRLGRLVDGFSARRPEQRPTAPPARTPAEKKRLRAIKSAVEKYFGGNVPLGVRVVWDPTAFWDARFDRQSRALEINAALTKPSEISFKLDHEIGHLLFLDPQFAADFETLWNSLPGNVRDQISQSVQGHVEKGYYDEGDAFEETRVRALEYIRKAASGENADPAIKRAWRRFVRAVIRAFERLTGRKPVDPQQLAAAMIEIGVARMQGGPSSTGVGSVYSLVEFETFKDWALREVAGDDFLQEDAGRLWVAADVDGSVNEVFGSFADADAYFRTSSHRGEFLWDVTESYERMVGGIPLRKPDPPITKEDVERAFYPMQPMPGETPSEAGNLPQLTPMGKPVTPAVLPDHALRYGLPSSEMLEPGVTPMRRVPNPGKPYRPGQAIFSIRDGAEIRWENRAQRLMRRIDRMYATGRVEGVEDLEAELESILEQADANLDGMDEGDDADRVAEMGTSDMAEFDSAPPDPEAQLVNFWLQWNGQGGPSYIRELARQDHATFGQYVRSSLGDSAYVLKDGVTDEQIEEAAQEAFANYERRRNAMLRVRDRRRRIASVADDSSQTTPNPQLSIDGQVESEINAAAQALANLESVFRVSFMVGDFDGAASAMDSADVVTFTAFADKLIRLAAAGDPSAEGMLEWIEVINSGTRLDTDIDPELEDLIRKMRERFPNRRRKGKADHLQKFHSPDAFAAAFAAFVAAGDFQSAYEAVRDTDDSIRIPVMKRFLKAAKGGDPVAKKNYEWMSHIFNGTTPPGVSQPGPGTSAPPPGNTPPPGSSTPPPGASAPPPGAPPPVAPQTPPPRPQGVEKLNIPALVFLAKRMGTTPIVKRFRARGMYQSTNPRGDRQDNPKIFVHEFLAKEDWQGAARTLAHEIGHFIDYIIAAVPSADLVKSLIPLQAERDQFIEDIFGAGTKYTEARKYMMEEAIALSKRMRGDFSPSDSYRMSAAELYADFLSAVMIDPDLAFDTAPLISHAWFAHLNQKPEAESAWNLIQDLIKGDGLHDAIRTGRVAEQRAAMAEVRNRADRRRALHAGWKKFRNGFAGALWSRYLPAAAKGASRSGRWEFTKRWWKAVTRPEEDDFLSRMEGAEIEASQRGSVLRIKMQRDVYDPLTRHGIDTAQLDEYLTFFQILNEDTATRQYLNANPDEFREFLLWLNDAASLSREAEIQGAADAELDEIGATMVGYIQLHDLFNTVYSAAQSVDAPDIAELGLFAFDIARYQWNQDGHTPETAQQGMDFLRRELGDERFKVLRDAARAFHQNLAGIVREANSVGLFSDRIWNEKIKTNLGNYVPRMVLEYFTGEMSASIKQRRGSVKATLPKQLAGEGQAMVLLHKIAKQKQMLMILEQAADLGWDNEIRRINIPKGKNVEALAKKMQREEGKGLRGYWVKGKWRWLEFDDIDVVRWMDSATPTDLKFLYDIAKANESFWRLSTTVLNASFALYNNWARTVAGLPMDYGPRAVAHTIRQIPEAVNWAKASLGRAEPSDRVLDLVERGVLPAFGQYTAGDLLLSHDDLIDQISSGLVGIDALRRGSRAFGPLEKVANLPGLRQVIEFLGMFTGTAEALPKLAVESLLEKRGSPQWERDRLARMEGIPNTGLSAGKYGSYAGLLSLFYRVWVQGTRRLMTLPFNPRTRGAWWMGNLLGYGAIKAFYSAAAAGILDALMGGGGDEEKQVDWQEAYTRVSPYKIRMADAFFLGWALPDGSYEPPYGHTSIPANWTPIMWRVPYTESGRLTAPLASLWTSLAISGSPLRPRNWREGMRAVRDVAQNSILPSLNPVFENGLYAASIFNPRSPYDAYSGRDVVPKDEWDAGIGSRAWGITRHLLEETPARNVVPAVKQGIRNENDLPPWARAIMSIPGASAAISFDNSPMASDYIDRIEERDSVNREARLLRGPKAIKAVSLRSRLIQIPAEKRTPEEQAKIEVLNAWYREAYLGSDLYPGLFRELQAAAGGMEGIDVKATKKALEETAGEVLREIGGVGR